jgi:hypothetical protein
MYYKPATWFSLSGPVYENLKYLFCEVLHCVLFIKILLILKFKNSVHLFSIYKSDSCPGGLNNVGYW